MALQIPAILATAARGAGRLAMAGAKAAPRAVFNAAGGSRVPILNKAFDASASVASTLAERRRQRQEDHRSREEDREESKDRSEERRQKTHERRERAEQENERRQQRAHQEGIQDLKDDETHSQLRMINRNTAEIKESISALVEQGDKEEGGGLLSKIGGLIMSIGGALALLPGKFAAALGGSLTRLLPKSLGGILSRAGGLARGAGGMLRAPAVAGAGLLGRMGLGGAAGAMSGAAAGTAGAGIAGKAGGTLLKTGGKAVGKSLLKKIPLIGAGVGIGLGVQRAMAGDWSGAGLEAASGLASTIPGLGTVASVGIDAGLAAKDYNNASGTIQPLPVAKKPVSGSSSTLTPTVTPAATAATVKSPAQAAVTTTQILSDMFDLMRDSSKGIYVRESTNIPQEEQKKRAEATVPQAPAPGQPASNGSTLTVGDMNAFSDTYPQGASTLTPAPAYQGLGSLSAKYESGTRGSHAIGWDSTGGTSYGKYQIASRTGTMDKFLRYADEHSPEVAAQLRAAGPSDGGKNGQFAQVWKQLADSGKLGDLEHGFIKKTHYDPAYNNLKDPQLKALVDSSPALQEALWSTSVQHGGGTNIFNKVFKEGMSERDLISGIYAERKTRFGKSSESVRNSVINGRFPDEERRALAMVGQQPKTSPMLRETATANAKPAVIVMPSPSAPAPTQQKAPLNGASAQGPSGTAMVIRDPSTPIRDLNRATMRGSVA